MASQDIPLSMNLSALKALRIIEWLADNGNEETRLQDLARALGWNASTVFRFLTALVESGYVKQNPQTQRYCLTYRICYIAGKVSANMRLYDAALPHMKEMARLFGESVCLAIEQDMHVVYIGVVPGADQMLHTMQRIGNRAPMHCTGVGKLLLLSHSDAFIDRMIDEVGLERFTENTITTRDALMAELAQVRQNGYAYDDEECEIGARCLAVPVYDFSGKIIAGLSITGPIVRVNRQTLTKDRIDNLVRCGMALSAELGYAQTPLDP